jgi:hypothetical protein
VPDGGAVAAFAKGLILKNESPVKPMDTPEAIVGEAVAGGERRPAMLS